MDDVAHWWWRDDEEGKWVLYSHAHSTSIESAWQGKAASVDVDQVFSLFLITSVAYSGFCKDASEEERKSPFGPSSESHRDGGTPG